ncbi:hypothetical protein BV20DRAFT_255454 [Pilatotrama ljubarskyi]|nr:hypothetical protein BV20DRAFT_255454 [Pilatotrama ljubarskyi]
MPTGTLSMDNSLGALLIGVLVECCLYGVTTLQTYIYFARTSADHKALKCLMFFLWVLNTLRVCLIAYTLYMYTITDFGNLLAILKPAWSVAPASIFTVSLNNCLVRGVLCYRVWHLSGKNWLLATAIALSILVATGTGAALGFLGMSLQSWFGIHEYTWLLIVSFSTSMAADVLITVTLCVLLVIRRTGHTRSDGIIRTLATYAVNTGALMRRAWKYRCPQSVLWARPYSMMAGASGAGSGLEELRISRTSTLATPLTSHREVHPTELRPRATERLAKSCTCKPGPDRSEHTTVSSRQVPPSLP